MTNGLSLVRNSPIATPIYYSSLKNPNFVLQILHSNADCDSKKYFPTPIQHAAQ